MAETYDAFEQSVNISPSSPEAYYAELAWNSAVARMVQLVDAARDSGIPDWHLTLREELTNLDTGLRHD